MGVGLVTGAAGTHFDATKRNVDSTTLRRQGRVIPMISRKGTSRPSGSMTPTQEKWLASHIVIGLRRRLVNTFLIDGNDVAISVVDDPVLLSQPCPSGD